MALLNNDVVEMTMRGDVFGQQIIMTHHYVCIGDAPVINSIFTDLDKFLDAWDLLGLVNVRAPYLACLPATYTLRSIRAQRIKATRSAYKELTIAGGAGTNANPATVACDSAGLAMRTFVAGRGHVGTKRIGPVPDGGSAAGLLTGAYQGLLAVLGGKLIQAFVPATLGLTAAPCLFNRDTGAVDIIQDFRVSPESHVANRRVVGRGK